MNQGTSLCLPYHYTHSNGIESTTLYRIADYVDGKYIPVNANELSDNSESFSPKFIQYNPADSFNLYEPVLRTWKIKSQGEKTGTLSDPEDNLGVHELLINSNNFSKENYATVDKLKSGIAIPDHIVNDFLLVVEQLADSYRTILCSKRQFVKNGNLYSFDAKEGNMLHMIHSLPVYIINKRDVFDTRELRYIHDGNGYVYPPRTFYAYTKLPVQDGLLYLYTFEDYLPYYLRDYIKKNNKQYDFKKNDIKSIVAAVKDALDNQKSAADFYKESGFTPEEVETKLLENKDNIIAYLEKEAFLSDTVTKILVSDEKLRENYISAAKELWMKDSDAEREAKQAQIDALNKDIASLDKKKTKYQSDIATLQAEIGTLRSQEEQVVSNIESLVNDFDSRISEQVTNSVVYKKLFNSSEESRNVSGLFVDNDRLSEGTAAISITNPDQLAMVLEHNLISIGMNAAFANIIGNLHAHFTPVYNSIVISGLYARNYADAFAFSYEGHKAARITIAALPINYNEIKNSIDKTESKVIVIENLLDACNETGFYSLCKDYKDKIFVFSFEDTETISLLNKNIWTYALLINADLVFDKLIDNPSYRSTRVDGTFTTIESADSESTEVNEVLLKLGLPVSARTRISRIIANALVNCSDENVKHFIETNICFMSYAYRNDTDDSILADIVRNIPEDYLNKYNFNQII